MGDHRGVKGTDPERTLPDGGPFRVGGEPPAVLDVDATVPAPGPPPAAAEREIEDPTIEPATRHRPADAAPGGFQGSLRQGQTGRLAEIREILADLVKRHEKKIWWLHTAYALSLGAFVATFAQKGFERARILTLMLTAAWVLVVFFFRFFGTGAQQDFMTAWPGARRRFFIMTYLMKNLFQGMLFFLLPFYWKSTSIDAGTTLPLALLGACAILSTLDLVFDRVLFRFKLIASAFFAVTLFGCANVVLPALFSDISALATLLVGAALSLVTFVLFHVPLASLRRPLAAGAFGSFIVFGVVAAYVFRTAMPPVPLYVKDGGVGTGLRDDGTLTVEVRAVRAAAVKELFCVTDVKVFGAGDTFRHVWRKGSKVLEHERTEGPDAGEKGVVRVSSHLPELPDTEVGRYTVDVETSAGQIVGRVVFDVKE